ncbi:hypothetical protein F5X68DRAFT_257700 [Plectosphaerella plurivora]|uniref:ribonuclease H n=1 Tax=Plectosphaerella plurivora TaxID=936078 RepID=A0A9P8VN79_9PEZI|nr:hypothetical protein F5X68DRAFT_257700 [Plectosphaerella plurivora]
MDSPDALVAPQSCLLCGLESSIFQCDDCQVVNYCSAAHRAAHLSKHKAACDRIKKSRKNLEKEDAALRAMPTDFMLPADIFKTGVGDFWGMTDTRDYMRARYGAAKALLQINTPAAYEKALAHFTDMIRLNESDNMGLRDIIPCLLLRLDMEQECYDFVKQWAFTNDEGCATKSNVPADIFESVDFLDTKYPAVDLAQLVSLTLLKLRLYLDLATLKSQSVDIDLMRRGVLEQTVKNLQTQYRTLRKIVHEQNPYFWGLLVDRSFKTPVSPESYTYGSIEEARVTLIRCRHSWNVTQDAVPMIAKETPALTTIYSSPTAATSSASSWAPTVKMKRGTGEAFPSKFATAPTSRPDDLFHAVHLKRSQLSRFVCRNDRKKILVYTDGACANNGQPNPRGGWALVWGPQNETSSRTTWGRLEDEGPFGDHVMATSNRAELRAVITALRMCDWRTEGFTSIVIATDSSYAADGATTWVKNWISNGWMTRAGKPVVNRDLWEALLGEVERWSSRGLLVEFWKIPRELNTRADTAAKDATKLEPQPLFDDLVGTYLQPPASQLRIVGLDLKMPDNDMSRLWREIFAAKIEPRDTMVWTFEHNYTLNLLCQEPPPNIIIDTDGSLLDHEELQKRVIQLMRGGATVVLAGISSTRAPPIPCQLDQLFTAIGLPWTGGSRYSSNQIPSQGVVSREIVSKLPSSVYDNALYADNVGSSNKWYIPNRGSDAASVASIQVGTGKFGYIGLSNSPRSSPTHSHDPSSTSINNHFHATITNLEPNFRCGAKMDAFQLNNEDVFGPSWREGRTLLLVNLPFHKTRTEIEAIVDTTVTEFAGGKLEKVYWPSDTEYRAPKHTGKLYIVVSDTKTAKAAAAYLDGSNWDGRCLKAVLSYRYVFERDVLGTSDESMAAEYDTQRLLSYHDTATPFLDKQSMAAKLDTQRLLSYHDTATHMLDQQSMAAELDTQRLLSYHDTSTPMLDQQYPVSDTLDGQTSLPVSPMLDGQMTLPDAATVDGQVPFPDFATLDGETPLSGSPRLVTVPFPQTPSAVPTFVAIAELFVENNRLRMRSSLQQQYISQLKRKVDELEERVRKSEAVKAGSYGGSEQGPDLLGL